MDKPTPQLSTADQRAQYGLRLYERGAVSSIRPVSADDVAAELRLSDSLKDDVETFLVGAGLIAFAGFGQVHLTQTGREWIEAGGSLDRPPAGSRTFNVNVGPGATVGAIQAGSDFSQQISHLEVNSVEAVQNWTKQVRDWLIEVGDKLDPEKRGRLAGHLDDIDDQVQAPQPDRGWIKNKLQKSQELLGEFSVSTAGSITAAGLIEAAVRIASLL